MTDLYQPIYAEFGEERTHRKRRELTAELGCMPSYIELYAALCLEDGPGVAKQAIAKARGV